MWLSVLPGVVFRSASYAYVFLPPSDYLRFFSCSSIFFEKSFFYYYSDTHNAGDPPNKQHEKIGTENFFLVPRSHRLPRWLS